MSSGDKNRFASLVVLSFHRAEMLKFSLASLKAHTPPSEVIVVDDGSRDECLPYLMRLVKEGKISTAILNGGPNRGVGEGIKRGFALASGAYFVKLDADLEYLDGWLDKAIAALEKYPDVGCIGWFDYRGPRYAPQDTRFNHLERRELDGAHEVIVVDDFVSSAMMIRASEYSAYGPIDSGSTAFAEDVVYKQKLVAHGFKLAILAPDLVVNHGFGLGRSTVVVTDNATGQPRVADIHTEPYLV